MYQPPIPPSIAPHSGRTALIYGIFGGLGLGIIESAVIVYTSRGNMYGGSYTALALPFSLLLWIIAFLTVSALAGKHTGKISTGTLTGLWAGMIGGIITSVTFFAIEMSNSYSGSVYMMASNLTYIIVLVLLALGIGTGLGALGGLIGQSFSASARTSFPRYQPSNSPQSYWQSDPPQAFRQSDPPQVFQQSNPPQLEQVQYQQNSSSQLEQQD